MGNYVTTVVNYTYNTHKSNAFINAFVVHGTSSFVYILMAVGRSVAPPAVLGVDEPENA